MQLTKSGQKNEFEEPELPNASHQLSKKRRLENSSGGIPVDEGGMGHAHLAKYRKTNESPQIPSAFIPHTANTTTNPSQHPITESDTQ